MIANYQAIKACDLSSGSPRAQVSAYHPSGLLSRFLPQENSFKLIAPLQTGDSWNISQLAGDSPELMVSIKLLNDNLGRLGDPKAQHIGMWIPKPARTLAEGTPKLYDPSDPTTYPSKEYLPMSNQSMGSTSHPQPNDGGYSGLPEV
ncbi:hypothetical protein EDB84DRAFT_1446172 [Lactarius hengduanensis]|nr:hypothetical protein EDB84DRAFT_1446172 [Lactarius hengduanensis]